MTSLPFVSISASSGNKENVHTQIVCDVFRDIKQVVLTIINYDTTDREIFSSKSNLLEYFTQEAGEYIRWKPGLIST